MGSIFKRSDSAFWWISFIDAGGRRRRISAETTDEVTAKKRLEAMERKVRAEAETGLADEGPVTLKRYVAKWLEGREARGVGSVDDDRTRLKHALPKLGDLLLVDVRPRHLRELVRELVARKELAPRSVRHVYGVLHTLFADAAADELISASPCVLREDRGELPAKRDQDPLWRHQAVFAREEVEALISDPRIPEDRRVLYALLFLAGVRIGEAGALRWSRYDARTEPLGRLLVATSFNHRTKLEKGTKTETPREVPVHPQLAKVLARWKVGGWARMLGREPGVEDLLIPSREGRNRRASHVLRRLHEDLTKLGLRARRVHDARRTFISLAQADGARPHILKWITHGGPRDIVGSYTTFPWETLCKEVALLRIGLREGRLVGLPMAVGHGPVTFSADEKKAPKSGNLGAHFQRGVRDLNPYRTAHQTPSGDVEQGGSEGFRSSEDAATPDGASDRDNVTDWEA